MKKQTYLIALVVSIAAVIVAGVATWNLTMACPDLSGWGDGPKVSTDQNHTKLTGVTAYERHCYDRVVLDVGGQATRYSVQYMEQITSEGQGIALDLGGKAKLAVITQTASYNYDTDGKSTYTATVNQTLPGVGKTDFDGIKAIKWGGSFEGQSTIGIGTANRLPFRVVSQGNQLIIDVAHSTKKAE